MYGANIQACYLLNYSNYSIKANLYIYMIYNFGMMFGSSEVHFL